MLQPAHLLDDPAVHGFVAVAHADGDDAAEKIEILIAVRIPHELVFCVCHHQWFPIVVKYAREKILLIRQNDFLLRHRAFNHATRVQALKTGRADPAVR